MNGRKNAVYALVPAIAVALVAIGCYTETSPYEKTGPQPQSQPKLVPETIMHLGTSMAISGQVRAIDAGTGSPVKFDGDRSVSFLSLPPRPMNLGGSGSIAGGFLNFGIGAPASLALVPIRNVFGGYDSMYESFSIVPAGAKGLAMKGLATSGDGMNGWMHRMAPHSDGPISTLDEVFYVYVNSDVVLTGRAKMVSGAGGIAIAEGTSMGLNAGWNAIHLKSVEIRSPDRFFQIVKMSAADPDWVGWVIRESGGMVESADFLLPR